VRQRRRRAGGREGREKGEPDEIHAISKERRGMCVGRVPGARRQGLSA